jgi:uncharacterized protein (DUF58 family)
LRLTAKKHDLIVIRVTDPAEEELPDVGLTNLQDPETGQVAFVNTGSKRLRGRWRSYQEERTASLSALLRKAGVDLVELSTDGRVIQPLISLFEKRSRRL